MSQFGFNARAKHIANGGDLGDPGGGDMRHLHFASALALLLTACGQQSVDAPPTSIPTAIANSCLVILDLGGLRPLGAPVEDLVTGLSRPDASLAWETSANGYILRQTIDDQLTGTQKLNSFSLVANHPGADAAIRNQTLPCGPGTVVVERIVLAGQELPVAAVPAVTLQLVATQMFARAEAAKAPSPAPSAPADATIPATELQDLVNPPNPATIIAVVERARELCKAEGTEDAPLDVHTLFEMAEGQVAAFEAAGRRGFRLSATDERCLRDAKATVKDYAAATLSQDGPSEDIAEPDGTLQ